MFDHVFFADGYTSENRKKFIFDDVTINPIKVTFYTPILVLYYNIEDIGKETCNLDIHGNKKKFNENDIPKKLNSMLYVQSLIGLIYRTNLFYDKLDSSKVSNNLWINGFKNFDDFNKTFNDTIKFIKKYINLNGVDPIIDKFMKLTFNNVSKIDIAFLNDMYLFKKYINIYKNFVYGQLKDNKALEKNFMNHSVLPKKAKWIPLILRCKPGKL